MNNVRTGGTYLLLVIALVGCLLLIYQGRGNEEQAWAVTLLIIGALVRDAASIQSAQSTERIAAATMAQQPTVTTTTAGPPRQTTTIEPGVPAEGDYRDMAHNP